MNKIELMPKFTTMQRCWLASYDGEYPRVRPMILIVHDGRFWLATGTEDAKTTQLMKHPKIEVSVPLKENEQESFVRIKGIAHYTHNPIERETIWHIATFIQNYFYSPEHPGFGLIEIHPATVSYMPPNSSVEESFNW
ncbi:MAG: pyridoxamine 5'-phosphate oxidase family protein [Candidatus Cloacimonetes bacterium]|nr:pyridoxamine 5'-phosphate oxidase family protein [Candidatus Cloacimonadota bacterium]